MSLIKLLAYGAVGYVAWRAWQDHHGTRELRHRDDGSRTSPHGDPVLAGERIDVAEPLRPAAHVSRGFGED